jgi:hypothetical protein
MESRQEAFEDTDLAIRYKPGYTEPNLIVSTLPHVLMWVECSRPTQPVDRQSKINVRFESRVRDVSEAPCAATLGCVPLFLALLLASVAWMT